MNPGYIYILQNPSFPEDLLKIGKTTRTPKERAEEVSKGTGIPTKFNVVFDIFTPDCDISEKEVHEKLKKYRVTTNREFFKLDIDIAKEAVITVVAEYIENEIILLEETAEKRILQLKNKLGNDFSEFKKKLKNEIIEKRKYLKKIKSVRQEEFFVEEYIELPTIEPGLLPLLEDCSEQEEVVLFKIIDYIDLAKSQFLTNKEIYNNFRDKGYSEKDIEYVFDLASSIGIADIELPTIQEKQETLTTEEGVETVDVCTRETWIKILDREIERRKAAGVWGVD